MMSEERSKWRAEQTAQLQRKIDALLRERDVIEIRSASDLPLTQDERTILHNEIHWRKGLKRKREDIAMLNRLLDEDA